MERLEPSSKTILVVDDDPGVLNFLKDLLTIEGFKVITSSDGRNIEKIAGENKIDLITMDLMMPFCGGWEGIKKLQAHDTTRDTPIFVVTGRAVEASTQEMITQEPNVKEYFSKPINRDLFLLKIHQFLGTKSQDIRIVEKLREFEKKE